MRLKEAPTILFVGNLIELKGVTFLISALAKVKWKVPDARLVVCGGGPLAGVLSAQSAALGLSGDIDFVGRIARAAIPDYFRACDVLVLPSLSEGSGNVLVEAAACGKPVIGSGISGILDYIDDGETGFFFRPRDPDDLAAKLVRLLADPPFAERLGRQGRDRVERRHGYDQMIDQLIAIFRQVITARREKAAAP